MRSLKNVRKREKKKTFQRHLSHRTQTKKKMGPAWSRQVWEFSRIIQNFSLSYTPSQRRIFTSQVDTLRSWTDGSDKPPRPGTRSRQNGRPVDFNRAADRFRDCLVILVERKFGGRFFHDCRWAGWPITGQLAGLQSRTKRFAFAAKGSYQKLLARHCGEVFLPAGSSFGQYYVAPRYSRRT